MLKNAMLFAVSSIAIVAFAPALLPMLKSGEAPPALQSAKVETPPAPAETPEPVTRRGEVHISADRLGQYATDVTINGQSVRMIVDTGASYVTLSAETADRLGLRPGPNAPRGTVRTANGIVEVRQIKLSTVVVGEVYMANVDALVLDRRAGDVNLLGSNFLKRLAAVEQRDGWLYLKQ